MLPCLLPPTSRPRLSSSPPPPLTMASYDDKNTTYDEKTVSSSPEPPYEVGQVSGLKRRLPKFSLEVRQEESSFAATKNASNADFDPIPPSKRTWNWGAYLAYWMADAWAVSNWEVASSIIAVGLSWKMAIGACVLGNTIMGIVITVNGRMGATVGCVLPGGGELSLRAIASHSVSRSRTYAVWILFQLLCRLVPLRPRHCLARVGFRDHFLSHSRRLIVHSVQTTTGGQCMAVLLTAIWPSYANIKNTIPLDQGITTSGMIAFFLYFLLQLPFLCIPYTKVSPRSKATPVSRRND